MAKASRRGSFRAGMQSYLSRQESRAGQYLRLPKGINAFKVEANKLFTFDILPYFVTDKHHPERDDEYEVAVDGSLWFRRPYRLHRDVGAGNESVVCPTSFGQKCPICEYREDLIKNQGQQWDSPAAQKLSASRRALYYVVPKGSRDHDDHPYLWDISDHAFFKRFKEYLETNEDYFDFQLLDNGLTLKVRFSEEKMGRSTYPKASIIEFVQRDYEYPEKVCRDLASLDDVLVRKSYADIESMFFDADGEDAGAGTNRSPARPDDEGEGESGRPSIGGSSLSRPRATGQSRQRDLEPEPEPEAEEAQPRRQRPASAQVRPPAREAEGPRQPPRRDPPPSTGESCPSGHRFGTDNDEHEECAECPVWNECYDEKQRVEA